MGLSVGALDHLIESFGPQARRVLEAAGRLVYPPHCLVCGRAAEESEDRYICRDCIAQVQCVAEPTCPRCGHELGPHTDQTGRCVVCRNMPMRFDRAVAAAHHLGPIRDLVLALKFAGQRQNALPLGKFLVARLMETEIPQTVQTIVPVPLHRRRRRARGFNQSELLAEELGRRLGLPVLKKGLRRVVDTPPQTQVSSPASRRANVKGAFSVRKRAAVERKSVLLVDDVLTTGATTSECAGVLKRAGAGKVFVVTVTRRMTTPPQSAGRSAQPVRYEIESAPWPRPLL